MSFYSFPVFFGWLTQICFVTKSLSREQWVYCYRLPVAPCDPRPAAIRRALGRKAATRTATMRLALEVVVIVTWKEKKDGTGDYPGMWGLPRYVGTTQVCGDYPGMWGLPSYVGIIWDSRWWFQRFFIFTPKAWGNDPN